MAYTPRRTRRHTIGSPELAYLVVVLVAGMVTAWWAINRVGPDLSVISYAASVLGITEGGPNIAPQSVGYMPGTASADDSATPAAAYCANGQAPVFGQGLADLKAQLGDTMGTPIECAHPGSSVDGDTVQQTSTGLAAYNSLTDTSTFTDGWHHWAMTSSGLVTWEGTDPYPPTG